MRYLFQLLGVILVECVIAPVAFFGALWSIGKIAWIMGDNFAGVLIDEIDASFKSSEVSE